MSDTILLAAVTANATATSPSLFNFRSGDQTIKAFLYAHGGFGAGNVSFTVPFGAVDVEIANLTAAGVVVVDLPSNVKIKATLAGATAATLTAGVRV